ncbi:MAG: flagellar motor protein MotB [Acidobacteriota bacterium]|nr:flagellar motor protein MotB [Acidobacteriota bacterium]
MSDDQNAPPPEECKCEKGAPKWVVTFGDMMSLLLTFFVLLLSFSTTDIIKYKKMVGSVKEAFGMAVSSPSHTVPTGKQVVREQIRLPTTFAAVVAVRAKSTRAMKSHSEMEMESGGDWVRIKVSGDAMFDEGDWLLRTEAEPMLDDIAEIIKGFEGVVTIEGHTDGAPPRQTRLEAGSYVGDYELGMMRAIAVTQYLRDRHAIEETKLAPTSFGNSTPRETNEVDAGRQRNRRVEFEFKAAGGDIGDIDGQVIRAQ